MSAAASRTAHAASADPGEAAPAVAPHWTYAWAARAFVVVAIVEAITWGGLLVGMYLKYVSGTTDVGVTIFGNLYGYAFFAYVAITIAAALRLRWRWWVVAVVLVAAIPPFMTIVAEIWIRKSGRLAPASPNALIHIEQKESPA